MTDNMKRFLEEASKDKKFIEKLKTAPDKEAVIALAGEKGFDLTPEDLEYGCPADGALSDSELEAVVGGDTCRCFIGGGGEVTEHDEGICACVMYGQGDMYDGEIRCVCPLAGLGDSSPS